MNPSSPAHEDQRPLLKVLQGLVRLGLGELEACVPEALDNLAVLVLQLFLQHPRVQSGRLYKRTGFAPEGVASMACGNCTHPRSVPLLHVLVFLGFVRVEIVDPHSAQLQMARAGRLNRRFELEPDLASVCNRRIPFR